jgi:hypothetical protein
MADAPGWYPDPLGRRRWRYFDGVEWTSDTRSAPPSAGAVAEVDDDGGIDWGDEDDLTEAQLLARARGELDEDEDEDEDDELEHDELDEDEVEVELLASAEPRSPSWSDDGLGWDEEELAWLAETDDLWSELDDPPGDDPDPEIEAEPDPEPEPDPGPEPDPEPEDVEDPEVVVELDPVVIDEAPRPVATAEVPPRERARPAHLAPDREAGRRELAEVVRTRRRGPAVYRRRRAMLGLVVVALVALVGIVVVRPMLDGPHALDAQHAVLRYEGDASGATDTVTEVVVDGDDLLQDRRTGDTHSVSLIEGRTSYTCRLDADPALCVRSFAEGAQAAIRSAAAFYLDPLSADGTFGSSAADAQPVQGRTVAGRVSRCARVRVAGKAEPYTVCRDADFGFLTYAEGPSLKLTLTSAKGPKSSDVAVPDVKVQDERNR